MSSLNVPLADVPFLVFVELRRLIVAYCGQSDCVMFVLKKRSSENKRLR